MGSKFGSSSGFACCKQRSDEQFYLQIEYSLHPCMTRSRFPYNLAFGIDIAKQVEYGVILYNVFQDGRFVGPRISSVVEKTPTGLAGPWIIVNEFRRIDVEEWIVE